MTSSKNAEQPAKTVRGRTVVPDAIDLPLRFEFLVAAVLMVLAICLLYPELVFHGRIIFSGDAHAAASFASVGRRARAAGEFPLWNPYLFSGMPSYGSLSYAPVYPLNYVIGLLTRYLFFPRALWLLFHTWLTGIAVYALLRDRSVSWAPAMAAGALMIWMPNLVAVAVYGHGSQACSSAFIPLALLFQHRVWTRVNPVASASGLALVLGLSMLRGHLQISFYTYLLVGMHLVFFGGAAIADAIRGRKPEGGALPEWLRRKFGGKYTVAHAFGDVAWGVLVLAAVTGVSLLISAELTAPVHEYARHSIRGASAAGGLSYRYATSWSLHPMESLTFLFPYAFGFGKDTYFGHMPFTDYPNYLGLITVFFAVVAMARARTRFVWFLCTVSVFTTFVSFGSFFPLVYKPMFHWMPFFDKFRVPVMILIVQQFAVVLLAGIGMDAAMRIGEEGGKKFAVIGLAAAFVVFMIVVLSQGYWSGSFAKSISGHIRSAHSAAQQLMVARVAGTFMRDDLMRFAVCLSAILAVLFLYFNYPRFPASAAIGLLLVLGLIDLHLVDRNIIHPETFRHYEGYRVLYPRDAKERYEHPDSLIDFLKTLNGPYRILPLDSPSRPFGALFASNRFMNFEVASVGGYHPAKLAIYDRYMRVMGALVMRGRFGLVDLLNARYFVSGAPLPWKNQVTEIWHGRNADDQPRYVYRNPSALPRAFLVGSYRVARGDDALRVLVGNGFNPRHQAVLESKPSIAPTRGSPGKATIESSTFNTITLRTRADTPRLLVLSEVYYPEWKVTVDGKPGMVLRADYILRAVAIAAGEHEITFRYDATLVRRWRRASSTALIVVALIFVGFTVRDRRRRSV